MKKLISLLLLVSVMVPFNVAFAGGGPATVRINLSRFLQSTTYYNNQKQVPLYAVKVTNVDENQYGLAGIDVYLTSLTLDGYIDGDQKGTFGSDYCVNLLCVFAPFYSQDDGETYTNQVVSNLSLYQVVGNGEIKIAGPIAMNNFGKYIFDFNLKIASGAAKNLIVKGDINANAPIGSEPDRIKFSYLDGVVTSRKAGMADILTKPYQYTSALNHTSEDKGIIMTLKKFAFIPSF